VTGQAAPDYRSPTLAVWHHSVDFAADARFMSAYRSGMGTAAGFFARAGIPGDVAHEWPVAVACWAGWHAARLDGDFVECGVNTGILARAVCEFVGFNALDRDFYLFDTFAGIPKEQMSPAELEGGRDLMSRRVYAECHAEVARTFALFPRVRLVRGVVPDTLASVSIDRVAYLSIDMNIVAPEIAALEHFWDRLLTGAVVLLDDYGKRRFVDQRRGMDEFAASRGVRILDLPTGQGLLLKP
jgi:O-methyltransferase